MQELRCGNYFKGGAFMLFQKRKCSEGNLIERFKRGLETADAVLIGAGSGLSTSAGLFI